MNLLAGYTCVHAHTYTHRKRYLSFHKSMSIITIVKFAPWSLDLNTGPFMAEPVLLHTAICITSLMFETNKHDWRTICRIFLCKTVLSYYINVPIDRELYSTYFIFLTVKKKNWLSDLIAWLKSLILTRHLIPTLRRKEEIGRSLGLRSAWSANKFQGSQGYKASQNCVVGLEDLYAQGAWG